MSTHVASSFDSFKAWRKIGGLFIQHLESDRKRQESGECGLDNFGHSCYVNSALQCLSHIRPFVETIFDLQKQYQLPPITSAYAQLLTEMRSISKGFTSAYELKVRIGELNQRFAGTDEQDSHEFLTVLLEALHDELMDNDHNSPISDLMYGTVRSTVTCLACGEETNTDDSFSSLPLPIRRSAPAMFKSDIIQNIFENFIGVFGTCVGSDATLYSCLEDFLSLERLGVNGQWFCQNCQKPNDATKKFDLWQLPRVLIIQLKRFTYDLSNETKMTKKISAKPVLNLEQLVNKFDKDQPAIYDLVAVLTHKGTLASGHYTTFARHLYTDLWYHFNDRHVCQASLDEAMTSDAYVLVYVRQQGRSSS